MRSFLSRSVLMVLGSCIFLCWQTPAQAQVIRMQQPRFILLMDEAVQKELQLTPDQIKKVTAETADLFQETPDGQKRLILGPDIDTNEVDERMGKLLKPEQSKRLHELHLQRLGYRALTLERVAKELKLTGDQQNKIDQIMENYHQKIMEKVQEQQQNQEGVIRVTPEMLADLDKELAKDMAAVLTADQKKLWETMQGAKFRFTPRKPAPPK